jgi:cytochrome b6-f complex iron-sulfur subunit
MERRSFLGFIGSALGLTAFGSMAYPLIRYLAPPKAKHKGGTYTFTKADIGDSKEIVYQQTPAIIINRPGKGYIALSRVCTHLGCLVEYDRGSRRLVCPCHAGTFDLEGRVLSGPPPSPLPTIPLSVEGEEITIG